MIRADPGVGAIDPDGRDRHCDPLDFAARDTVGMRWKLRALEAICKG